MQILHELIHCLALGCTARESGNLGLVAAFISLMNYDLDFHGFLPVPLLMVWVMR